MFSFTFCEYPVKLICHCFFFAFLSTSIDCFLSPFCEKATPSLLLEIANCWLFCLYLLFREAVKFVIIKLVEFILLFFSLF